MSIEEMKETVREIAAGISLIRPSPWTYSFTVFCFHPENEWYKPVKIPDNYSYTLNLVVIVDPKTRVMPRKIKSILFWAPCPSRQQCMTIDINIKRFVYNKHLLTRRTHFYHSKRTIDNMSISKKYNRTCNLFCDRPRCYHIAKKTQVKEDL